MKSIFKLLGIILTVFMVIFVYRDKKTDPCGWSFFFYIFKIQLETFQNICYNVKVKECLFAILRLNVNKGLLKMRFCCPKCQEKLNIEEKRAVCKNGHSFDRARGGYYNLLLGNAGGVHGDNKDMVLARRAFLGVGYYAPLARYLAFQVLEYTPKGGCLLDAGAGEGYYTDIIERVLFERDGTSDVSAYDISKDAVREISKKNPRISLAVAGSYHMPIADGEFDTVINTFSPLALSETLRVLKKGGHFIMAIPGEEHLFDLKKVIYDTPYKNEVMDTYLEGFELVEDEPLTYKFMLDSPERIQNLFMMTPYAYRTKPGDRAKVEALKALECTADFRIFVYKKL